MRLVVVVAALVGCFVDHASSQSDCAEPTERDFENVIPLVIPDSENPTTPEIDLIDFKPVCLAHSQERGRFRGVSALVAYTCTGNALCPDGTAVEQFEADCDSGSWSHLVRNSGDNTRTQMPNASFSSTNLRENCAFCYSPKLANVAGLPSDHTPDDENHCVACDGCSESPGQDRCTGITPGSCCNVYVDGMCDSGCPDDGVYTIDPTTFECLEICPNLGNIVENGIVSYSQAIPDGEAGFSEGTTATVVCNTGYRGGGVTVCESGGDWLPFDSLPSCEIVDCGPPPELDNGNVTFDSTLFDSVATYECDEDYFFDDRTKTTRTCDENGDWSNADLLCKICELPNCKICVVVDGKPVCQDCNDGFEKVESSCDEISGGGSDDGICVICIVIPIAIILAIILAVAVAIAVYAYYRWKHAPPTNLKEKDAEGINGVARNNPLYLDPVTVADEVEE